MSPRLLTVLKGFLYISTSFLITILVKGGERSSIFSLPWQVWTAATIQGFLAWKAFLSDPVAIEKKAVGIATDNMDTLKQNGTGV